MARTTPCERQLMRAAADAAFRVLPPMVRLIWLELYAFAAGAPEKGRIRFLGSVTASVSRLLSIPETDVEAGLETLAALGWVEHDAATNSLWMPGARANTAKAEAARANGIRGGRPRAGETPAQANARKQGNLILPIAGGQAETQGTKPQPMPESSRAVLTNSSLEEKVSTARETPDWVHLGMKLAEIARLDPARGGHSYHVVKSWMAMQGATEERIAEAVRKVASRPKYDPTRQRIALEYFTAAVTEHLERVRAAAPASDQIVAAIREDAISQRRKAWAANPVGPMPRRAAA
jgi:hypothetical protein